MDRISEHAPGGDDLVVEWLPLRNVCRSLHSLLLKLTLLYIFVLPRFFDH